MFLKNCFFFICANSLIFDVVLKKHCFDLLYQCRLILLELWSIPYVLQASNILMCKYLYLEIRRVTFDLFNMLYNLLVYEK